TIATDGGGRGSFSVITECNCPDFKKNRSLYKHVAMVKIHLLGYEFQKRKPQTQAQDVLEDALVRSLKTTNDSLKDELED
ncbi:hypothetical protein BGX31_003053, partial [Mortierella sp. GBA43]